MSRIYILGTKLTDAEVERMKVLANQAGYDQGKIEVAASIGAPDPDGEDEVILMLATSATCADPNLEKELTKAQNGGRRVICIWPNNAVPSDLPDAAAKYCYSVIPWDADKVRAVAADDNVMYFETPTGEPRPKIETERNLCVEQKAQAK
jgi:hypothetical protein